MIEENRKTIIIVTGMPRAGTSLMMKMLDLSGFEVFAGEKISYEASATNILNTNNDWVLSLNDLTAMKVLWPQCTNLPTGINYKFIWMRRDPKEQARSQARFLGKSKNWRKLAEINSKKVNNRAPSILRQGAQVLTVHFEAVLRGYVAPIEEYLGRDISIAPIISRMPRAGMYEKGKLEGANGNRI